MEHGETGGNTREDETKKRIDKRKREEMRKLNERQQKWMRIK